MAETWLGDLVRVEDRQGTVWWVKSESAEWYKNLEKTCTGYVSAEDMAAYSRAYWVHHSGFTPEEKKRLLGR